MVYVQHKIDVLLKPEINNRRELNNSIEFDLYNIFLHFIKKKIYLKKSKYC